MVVFQIEYGRSCIVNSFNFLKNIFWIPYPLVKDSALIYHENWSFVIENSWEIGQFNAFFTAILEFEFRFNSVMLWSLCKEMMRFFRTLKLISIFSWLCLTWCKHIKVDFFVNFLTYRGKWTKYALILIIRRGVLCVLISNAY